MKRSSRGSRILCAKVGAALTDRVPVALRPGSWSVALASTRQRLIDERRVGLAGGGEPKAPRLAVEQLDAEPAFERLHAVAHRAGGEIELFRGLAEAVVPGGSLENPK